MLILCTEEAKVVTVSAQVLDWWCGINRTFRRCKRYFRVRRVASRQSTLFRRVLPAAANQKLSINRRVVKFKISRLNNHPAGVWVRR